MGFVLVESLWKAGRRPYHKQKLALLLANLRHFALEQQRRGVAVRHVVVEGPYREALEPLVAELGPLRVMERLWSWAKLECLPAFGPFEDAMSERSSTLFHTRISGLRERLDAGETLRPQDVPP